MKFEPKEVQAEPISDYNSLYQAINAMEYHIHQAEGSMTYQCVNRNQNLRANWEGNGLQLVSRTDAKAGWALKLKTSSINIDGKALKGEPKEGITNKDTLDLCMGNYREQYINNSDGLRQNFIIEPGAPKGDKIRVELEVEGMEAEQRGKDILFKTNGQELTYSELKVWDAQGRILESKMGKGVHGIWIEVDSRDAEYPVTIDPIIANGNPSNANTTVESNQSNAWLGYSLSGAGDVNGDGYSDVIVGSPLFDNGQADEGAVFIFHGSSTGLSTTAAVMLEANQASAWFGNSVSGAGDVNGDGYSDVIVGSYLYDNGQSNEGAVFVYHGSVSGVSSTEAIRLESNSASANFGYSVSRAGDINADGYSDIVIGATGYSNGQSGEGRVYVYHGSSTGITSTPATTMESDQSGASMGVSVSLAGDINGDGYSDIVVGAQSYDSGQTDEGAAFVYHGSSSGVSSSFSTLLDIDQASCNFGQSVSGIGDVNGDGYSDIIVGAPDYDNGQVDEGATFIYHGSGSGISTSYNTILEDNQANASFGTYCSGAGDVNADGFNDVIITISATDISDDGKAYVFHGSSSGVNSTKSSSLETNLTSAKGSCATGIGDINGDGYSDVMFGSALYSNGQTNEGAAFVFHGSPSGIINTFSNRLESNQNSAFMGYSVSSAGDVNGDGYSDIIVGVPKYDNGQTNEGIVYVYYGSSNGVSTTPSASMECNQDSAEFGFSVSGAGDINGDGYSDILVGAPYFNNGHTDEGAVFVYLGSSSGISTIASDTLESNQTVAYFGYSVSSAGDVNADGFSDIVIGAPQYEDGQADEGHVFIYHGSSNGISSSPNTTLQININNVTFGNSVSGAGDVNGDGFSDIIVGARFYYNGQTQEGAALVYHGSSSGISTTAANTIETNQINSEVGTSVSAAGDVNGDGYGDVIIGAYKYDKGQADEGVAYVHYGSSSGISSTADVILEPNQMDARFGISVSSAGDVNGDGYGDVVVGSYLYDNGQSNEGAAFVYLGSSTGLPTIASVTLEINQAIAYFGYCVSGAGDVNGDGYSDLLVGDYNYDNGQSDEGACFVYQGNNNGGLRRNIRLYEKSTTNPISQGNDTFALGVFVKNPEGRSKAKLAWEVKKEGVPFSSGSTVTNSVSYTGIQSNLTSLSLTGTEITQNVTLATSSRQTKIRARIRYDLVTSLNGQVFSQWLYPPDYFKIGGMSSTPLPVELIYFTVEGMEGQKVLLKWQTASEINNEAFDIEWTIDGKDWIKLGEVKGAGTTLDIRNYEFIHNTPLNGENYYRLRQRDYDGKYEYSPLRVYSINKGIQTIFYPNPVENGIIKIKCDLNFNETAELELYNLQGVFLDKYEINNEYMQLNLQKFQTGMYTLLMKYNSGEQYQQKIFIISR